MSRQSRHAYRNLAALTGDFVAFFIGFTFYDPIIVVPVFVEEITGSELMVGLLAAVRVLVITLPQVWAASVLAVRPRKKPLLVWSSVMGRLPILFLAAATLLWTDGAPWLVVGILIVSVALFFTSEGLNAISWPALVGKVIPEKARGRFFGLGQLLSSLGALGVGYVVRAILGAGGLPSSAKWATLFGCAFAATMLSVVSMLFVREEVEEKETNRVDVVQSVRAIIGYLRTDGRLRRLVAAQFALGVAGAAFPFFVVRARELIPSGDEMIGAFLVLQNLGGVAAAITCGYLMDRLGSWVSIRTGAALQTTALLAVIVAGLVDAPHLLYLPAFFMLGFVGGSSWWSFTSYLLDIATDEQRPTYLAASGILTSPTFVGSILVGGLFEVALPEAVFAAAMVVSAAGLLLAWALPKIRAGASAAPESRPSVAPAREHGR